MTFDSPTEYRIRINALTTQTGADLLPYWDVLIVDRAAGTLIFSQRERKGEGLTLDASFGEASARADDGIYSCELDLNRPISGRLRRRHPDRDDHDVEAIVQEEGGR